MSSRVTFTLPETWIQSPNDNLSLPADALCIRMYWAVIRYLLSQGFISQRLLGLRFFPCACHAKCVDHLGEEDGLLCQGFGFVQNKAVLLDESKVLWTGCRRNCASSKGCTGSGFSVRLPPTITLDDVKDALSKTSFD